MYVMCICMYLHVFEEMYVWGCQRTCLHMHIGAEGWHPVSSLITFHFIY